MNDHAPGGACGTPVSPTGRLVAEEAEVLVLGMIALGLAAFAAILAFVRSCERVQR